MATQLARKAAEIAELRQLAKAGTLSQAVAQAAIDTTENERQALERIQPDRDEKETACVLRMLPRAAEVLRERIQAGNAGLRNPVQSSRGAICCSQPGGQGAAPAGRNEARRATLLGRRPGPQSNCLARSCSECCRLCFRW